MVYEVCFYIFTDKCKFNWYLLSEEPFEHVSGKGLSKLKRKASRIVTFHSSLSYLIFLLKVAEELLTLAYENGINLFDTAEVYNSGK